MTTYDYPHFAFAHYTSGQEQRRVEVGRPAIDETLYDLDGNPVALSSLWNQRPIVVEFGSISCPIFVDKLDRMRRMAEAFAGRVDFSVVYVREAHPGRNYPPHRELGRKLRHAGDLQRLERVSRTVLVDGAEGTMHRDYGALPNAVYVIGMDGVISFRADWNDPYRVEAHLATLLRQDGKGGAIRPEELVDNFQRPSPGLLRQGYRVLRRAGAPALRDILREAPTMLRERLRLRRSSREIRDTT
jgi:peroxiredoxin